MDNTPDKLIQDAQESVPNTIQSNQIPSFFTFNTRSYIFHISSSILITPFLLLHSLPFSFYNRFPSPVFSMCLWPYFDFFGILYSWDIC